MSQTQIFYRLRIRNEDDSADLIVLSSHPGDTNALLCEAPEGEGQSIDPIMGTLEVGSYTWQAIDRFDGGDTYTITALLADVDARNQLLSHKAVGEYSNDGSSWSALHSGFLNDIKLSDAKTYTFIVGDSDRRERDAVLFKTITDQFDRVSNIIGGPVEAATPVAYNGTPVRAWGPVLDHGPARMIVVGNSTGGTPNPAVLENPDNRITLSLVGGILPPKYAKVQGTWNDKVPNPAEYIDQQMYQYFEADATGVYGTVLSELSQPFGSFPQLEAKLTRVSDSVVFRSFPIAQAAQKRFTAGDAVFPVGDEQALVANSNDWLIVAWDTGTMGAQPSLGTEFDVLVRPIVISEANPLHLGAHPVDLHILANEQEGIAYDAATAASTKATLGPLYYLLRITGEQEYSKFTEMLKGSAGYGVRYNADGEQEFFPTRYARPDSVATVTTAEMIGDERGEPKDVIFKVAESSTIKGVDFKLQQFRLWDADIDNSDRPVDGVVAKPLTINGTRRDESVKGSKIITYEVPGMILLAGSDPELSSQPLALRDWIIGTDTQTGAGEVIIDRAGWGLAEGELEVLATTPGAVGDYIDLEAPHQVNAKVGQSPVAQRGGTRKVQVTKRVEMPGTSKLTVKDAGNLAQDAPTTGDTGTGDATPPVPELSLAPSVDSPFTIATVTETNVADFTDIGADTELQYLVQTATPAPTDEGEFFGPLLSSTGADTIDAPAIASGETIWVRGRAKLFNGQRGDWSDWISITLGPDDTGTGSTLSPFLLALSIDAGGILSAEATSTVAEITIVYFLAGTAGGAAPAYADVLASLTVDSSGPPFTGDALASMAEGETRTVGAIGEDALGNRTVLILASITRGVNTGAATGTPGNFRLTLHAGSPRVFRNIDSALSEPLGMKGWRKSENLGAAKTARLQHNCYSATGGDLAIHLIYSLDKFASAPVETGVFVRADRPRYPEIGDYLAIADAALGDNVTLGCATKGGDGTMTLKTENVYLDVVSSDSPPPSATGDPYDVPQGGSLGNLILDLNAQAEADDGRADASAITNLVPIVDRTDITGDAGPVSSSPWFQSNPTFRTSGFPGSQPCIRMAADQGMRTPIPSIDSHTWYFVVGNITGAGSNGLGSASVNGQIMGTFPGGSYSNGALSIRTDGKLYSWINSGVFGTNDAVGANNYNGSGPHLITLTWNRLGSSYSVYVDGTLEMTVSSVTLNGTNFWSAVTHIGYGNAASNPDVLIDYGRILCYDAPHGTGELALVRAALQGLWSALP